MNTETITLYKDGEEIVVDVQRVEEFSALGYAAVVSEEIEDKAEANMEGQSEDEAKPAGKGRSKSGK